MNANKSYYLKFCEVFFLLLVIIGLSQYSDWASDLQMQVLTQREFIWIACGVLLGLSAILALVWHILIQKEDLHKWVLPVITFYVAHQIATYGAAKILKTQFQAPNFILERPVGELSGFWLTWTYFGYSDTFAFILGAIQVLGAILLIFRKTRLLATFILLPVIINVDFIDHFYNISPLAYYNSLHYTLILVFLMFQDTDKIIHAFFSYKEYFYINGRTLLLNLLRVLVIGGAFVHILWLRNSFQPKTAINGVWKVDEVTIHHRKIVPSAANADKVWSRIYFEWRYGCLFRYSPYQFNDKKDLQGHYEVDEEQQQTRIAFENKGGSMKLNYRIKDNAMLMWGIYGKDSLMMKLTRLK